MTDPSDDRPFYPFDEAFKLLHDALGQPLSEVRQYMPPEGVALSLLWPVAVDWYKGVACLGTPYPPEGEVVAPGTGLMFLRYGDPEYGDFWRILDGRHAGILAVFGCQCGFPGARSRIPGEWGVVSTDEPLLSRPGDARRLFDQLVGLLPDMR